MNRTKQIEPKIIWYVYMLECSDKSIYTGITTNLKRRINEHNNTKAGAKYTRARRPVKLRYYESHPSKSQASSREYSLKKLKRSEKLTLRSKDEMLLDTLT